MYQSDNASDYLSSSTGLPWYRIWLKALIPERDAYKIIAADPGVSIGKACLWVFLANFIGTTVGYGFSALTIPWFAGSSQLFLAMTRASFALFAALSVIGVVCLLTISGFVHIIAYALGGTSTFTRLAYVVGSYMAPLTMMGHMGFIIPFVWVPVVIYEIALTVIAVKDIHQLTWGRAIASGITPWVIWIYCVVVVLIIMAVEMLRSLPIL